MLVLWQEVPLSLTDFNALGAGAWPRCCCSLSSRWQDEARLSDLEPKFAGQDCGHRSADIKSNFQLAKMRSSYQ